MASATEGDSFSLHKHINTHTHSICGLLRQELAPYVAQASPDFVIFCFSLLKVECIFMFLFIFESSCMNRFHALSIELPRRKSQQETEIAGHVCQDCRPLHFQSGDRFFMFLFCVP